MTIMQAGRVLSIEVKSPFGADVKVLHDVLGRLGYELPDEELRAQLFGPATDAAVRAFQQAAGLEASGAVDDTTVEKLSAAAVGLGARAAGLTPARHAMVFGWVRTAQGAPMKGVRARVWLQDLTTRNLLGAAMTDEAGQYAVAYPLDRLRDKGRHQPHLVVEVARDEDKIARTQVYQAGRLEEVNLVEGNRAYRGPSELERVEAAVRPHCDGKELADIDDKSREFLAQQSGEEATRVGALLTAAKLARKTELPYEALYALIRRGLGATLPALVDQGTDAVRRALRATVEANLVPERVAESADAVVERLRALRVERAFAEPTRPGGSTIADLVGTVLGDGPRQRELIELYARSEGRPEELWARVRERGDLGPYAQRLQTAMQLAAVTQNHVPLVRALMSARVESARELAKFDEREWEDLVRRAEERGLPGGVPRWQYADMIVRAVEEAFPTEVAAQRLQRGELAGWETAARFLGDHPELDLATGGAAALEALVRRLDRRERPTRDTMDRLRSLARLFRVTTRWREIEALLATGLDSAEAIAGVGRRAFARRIGKRLGGGEAGEARAVALWGRARKVHAASLALFLKLAPALDGPAALMGGRGRGDEESAETRAAFAALGAAETGDVPAWATVLGEPAYLVDLLNFLDGCDGPATASGGRASAKAALVERRPDLGRVTLGGAAATERLPEAQLVSELLEARLVDKYGGAAAILGTAPRYAAAAGGEEEAPPSVSAAASALLGERIAPWSLPFAQPLEEARASLRALGAPRAELVEAFAGPRTTEADVAAERLGLSARVRLLVSDVYYRTPWEAWGFSRERVDDPSGGGTRVRWDDAVAPAPELLRRSGLTLAELTTLLATKFVNPDGASELSPADATDVHDMTVTHLPPERLQRLHRFARLQRALGWTPAELDRAMVALGVEEIGDALLVELARVERLRARTGADVATVLSWLKARGEDAGAGDAALESLAAPALAIVDGASGLAPSLGLGEEELVLLVDEEASRAKLGRARAIAGDAAGEPVRRTTEALAEARRIGGVARGLKLGVEALLVWAGLAGASIETAAGIEKIVELRARASAVGLGLDELRAIVDHRGAEAEALDRAAREERRALGAALAEADARKASSDERRGIALDRLAAWTGLGRATAEALATRVLRGSGERVSEGAPGGALDDLLAPTVGEGAQGDDPRVAAAEAALVRARKAAILVERLGLGGDDGLLWTLGTERFLDANALPVAPAAPSVERGAALDRLLVLAEARAALPGGAATLAVVLRRAEEGERGDVLALLAKRSGWSQSELERLASDDGLGVDEGQLRSGRGLVRLGRAVALAQKVGVAPSTLLGWTAAEPSREQAALVAQVARARGAAEDGVVAARRLQALVDALVGDNAGAALGAADRDSLASALLVDLTTTSTRTTTRVGFAVDAVHRFVTRALLGRDATVVLDAEAAARWRHLESFAAWRERRALLLWPEAALLERAPSEATPLFRALEQALDNNSALDGAAAERAFRAYVAGLVELARLEVCGVGVEGEGDAEVIHLFARPLGAATPLWWRRVGARGAFSAWEAVDIAGGGPPLGAAVAPVALGGRLFLYWLEVDQRAVRLCFAERRAGGWSSRRIARGEAALPDGTRPSDLLLKARREPTGALALELHVATRQLAFDAASGRKEPLVWAQHLATARLASGASEPRVVAAPRGAARTFLTPDRSSVVDGQLVENAELGWDNRLTLFIGAGGAGGDDDAPERARQVDVLGETPGRFRIVPSAEETQFLAALPFVYQDDERTFLVAREERLRPLVRWTDRGRVSVEVAAALRRRYEPRGAATAQGAGAWLWPEVRPESTTDAPFRFRALDLAIAPALARLVDERGVEALFAAPPPGAGAQAGHAFEDGYRPIAGVVDPRAPRDGVDASWSAAQSPYLWELYVWAPLAIAARLRRAGRDEEALRWLRLVDDPLAQAAAADDEAAPRRGGLAILLGDDALSTLAAVRALGELDSTDGAALARREELDLAARRLAATPDDVHALARLRPTALRRAVRLGIVDALIASASRVGEEEARRRRALAAELLGPRPVTPPRAPAPPTEDEVAAAAPSPLSGLESALPAGDLDGVDDGAPLPTPGATALFRIPPNPHVTKLRDRL